MLQKNDTVTVILDEARKIIEERGEADQTEAGATAAEHLAAGAGGGERGRVRHGVQSQ